jgi:hypothetical protein
MPESFPIVTSGAADVGGWDAEGAASLIEGRGGSSGMAGTAGKLSFEVIVAADGPAAGEFEVVAAGAGEIGGGDVEGAVDGHAGAPLSAASEVPLVLVNGGTPSGDWLTAFAPARVGAGPSLIFTYKYAPTTARIVIVTSGRIEPIDRPP